MRQLTGGDTKACHEVVDNGKQGCSPLQLDPKGLDTAIQRDSDNQCDVEPIHMLVPIWLCYGAIGDVRFSRIVGFASIWLWRPCHGRRLWWEKLRLHGHMAGSRLMWRHTVSKKKKADGAGSRRNGKEGEREGWGWERRECVRGFSFLMDLGFLISWG